MCACIEITEAIHKLRLSVEYFSHFELFVKSSTAEVQINTKCSEQLEPIFSCSSSTQFSCHFFRPSGWTKDGASSIKLKASNNQNFTSNLSKFTALAISISQQQIIQFHFRVDLILLQPIRLHFQLAKLNQPPATCKAVRKIPVEENSDDEEAWEHRRHALAAIPAKMGPLNKTRELPLS